MNVNDYVIGAAIGEALLSSGAETYRVEDTVSRIVKSLGADKVNVYATFTSVMVSVELESEQPFTYIRTVYTRSVNLGRIAGLNELSRKIVQKKISIDDAFLEIKKINNMKIYSNNLKILSAGLIALSFGFVFTTEYIPSILSFFIGVINQFFSIKLSKFNLSPLISNIVLGASLAIFSVVFSYFFENIIPNDIIVGAIMPLVPGVILTNAMRDMESGHYISALAEMLHALLIALGIASGVFFILNLWFQILGGF